MKKNELTPTMQKAVDFAKQHANKLVRHPGGFWADSGFNPPYGISFGTSTVHGLVLRGAAEYTDWRDGRNGRFPVEITLADMDKKK